MNKSILRKKYKELRNNMSKEEVSVRSQSILQNLASHPLWAKSSTIMCFYLWVMKLKLSPLLQGLGRKTNRWLYLFARRKPYNYP